MALAATSPSDPQQAAEPLDPEQLNRQVLEDLKARAAGLEEQDRRRAQALEELAAETRAGFGEAHRARRTARSGAASLTDRLLQCQRQRAGQYEADVLSKIQAMGGSQTFFNITDSRAESLVAWVNEVVREKYFLVSPTPVPDLSPALLADLNRQVWALLEYESAAGLILDEAQMRQRAQQLAAQLRKQALKAERQAARERAEAMQEKMEDQLEEGGFRRAWWEVIELLATFPYAILEGPVIRSVRREKWSGQGLTVSEEAIPTFRAVSPLCFYPGVNMTDVNVGDLYHVDPIERSELAGYLGRPGWIDAELQAALAAPQSPASEADYLPEEREKAAQEGRDLNTNQGRAQGLITCLRAYRAVEAQRLARAGIEWAQGEAGYLDVSLLLVGTRLVYAGRNPDPLARRPYHAVSFKPVPGSFAGVSLAEVVRPAQEGMNNAIRNMQNNATISSLPIGVVDASTVDPKCNPTEIYGGKIYPFDGAAYAGRAAGGPKPVEWHFVPDNIPKLIEMANWYQDQADNLSRIPRFVFGDGDVQGAGRTMGGLSMLMNSAAKGVKQVILNLDQCVIEPLVRMLYSWNMYYLPEDQFGHLKGDCRVAARGSLTLMVQELADQGLPEILALFKDDEKLFAMVGMEGLATLAREMLERKNLPGLNVVPDEEEIREKFGALDQASQAALAMGAQPGALPGTAGPQAPAPAPAQPQVEAAHAA